MNSEGYAYSTRSYEWGGVLITDWLTEENAPPTTANIVSWPSRVQG